jgi:N-acyl amino acid synthase of PEP-CTERM/exosortase system
MREPAEGMPLQPAQDTRSVSSANSATSSGDASLIDTYNALFATIPATTPELQRECFHLRYQVYCVENSFLDPADNAGELETDEFDEHSLHALLQHRPTGLIAGTVRLVLPRPGALLQSMPLYAVCQDPQLLSGKLLPPSRTTEFSRFAISKQFRRRAGDRLYGEDCPSTGIVDSRRIIPHITLGLMAMALRMVQGREIDHVCAVMEPGLIRLLERLGIHFAPIGPLVDYHGRRQPCFSSIDALFARMERERHDVWEVVTNRGLHWPARLQPALAQGPQPHLRSGAA